MPCWLFLIAHVIEVLPDEYHGECVKLTVAKECRIDISCPEFETYPRFSIHPAEESIHHSKKQRLTL